MDVAYALQVLRAHDHVALLGEVAGDHGVAIAMGRQAMREDDEGVGVGVVQSLRFLIDVDYHSVEL